MAATAVAVIDEEPAAAIEPPAAPPERAESALPEDPLAVQDISFAKTSALTVAVTRDVAPDLLEKERTWWSHISFSPRHIPKPRGMIGSMRVKGHPTYLRATSDGHFIAVGMSSGAILVWDVWRPNPHHFTESPQYKIPVGLIRSKTDVAQADAAIFLQMVWSFDNCSQLLTLEKRMKDGEVAVCLYSMQPFRINPKPRHRKVMFPECVASYSPRGLTHILRLTKMDFSRPGGDINWSSYRESVQDQRKPTSIAFWPGITLLGHQPSIVIGTASGVVVKWNTDWNDERNGQRVVYGSCVATSEPDNPNERDNPNDRVPRHGANRGRFGSTIKREFFVDSQRQREETHSPHLHVRFICFVNNTQDTRMITVDQGNYIFLWQYTADRFTGSGIFEPRARYRLDLSEELFLPDKSHPTEQLFPPPRIKVPRNPEGNSRFLDLSQEAEKALGKEKVTENLIEHYTETNSQSQTQKVLRPKDVPNEGAAFHSVTYTDKGVLVEHITQYFKMDTQQGAILDMCTSTSGRDLIVATRFPPAPFTSSSNGPTLRFYLWDLECLQLRNYHLEISVVQYNQYPKCSICVSPVLEAPGSDYLYVLRENTVTIHSLASGQQMTGPLKPLTAADREIFKKSLGGHVHDGQLNKITVAGPHTHLSMIASEVDIPTVYMFVIEDNNDAGTCKSVSEGAKPRRDTAPAEQRVTAAFKGRPRWTTAAGVAHNVQAKATKKAGDLTQDAGGLPKAAGPRQCAISDSLKKEIMTAPLLKRRVKNDEGSGEDTDDSDGSGSGSGGDD